MHAEKLMWTAQVWDIGNSNLVTAMNGESHQDHSYQGDVRVFDLSRGALKATKPGEKQACHSRLMH